MTLVLIAVVIYLIASLVVFSKLVGKINELLKKLEEKLDQLDKAERMLRDIPAGKDEPPAPEAEEIKSPAPAPPAAVDPENIAELELKSEQKETLLPPLAVPRKRSAFEERTREVGKKIWNWFIVGEEYRKEGVKTEYAIASTWLLRGGFLLLLFGIGYFVKFSHERNLFPPELRLSLAACFAVGVIYAGCRMLNGIYRNIGLTLAGGGFASLYCVILAATSLYKLLPGTVAFGLLVFLTVCGIVLAMGKNAMLLALFAVTGGYLAPILTSSGSRNLTGLFLYMAILGLGVLFTTRFRSWRLLTIASFLFTWGLFFLASPFQGDYSFVYAWIAGSFFFLLFSTQLFLQAWRGKEKTALPELLLHFGNTFLYCATFIPRLMVEKAFGNPVAGALTLFLALYFLGSLSFCIRKKEERDEGLFLILLLEGAGLLALTFPLLFSKNIWVFAWSLQAILMLFGARKLGSRFMENFAYTLFTIASMKLFAMDMGAMPPKTFSAILPGLGERILNFGSLAAAFAGAFFLLKKYPSPESGTPSGKEGKNNSIVGEILLYGAYIFLFFFLWKETAFLSGGSGNVRIDLHIGIAVTALFLYLPLFLASRGVGCRERVKKVQLYFFFPAVLYFLIVIGICLDRAEEVFPGHVFSFLIAFLLLGACGRLLKRNGDSRQALLYLVTSGVLFFTYTSIECYQLMALFQSAGAANTALSILWMIYGLLLLWYGVKKEVKSVRFTGLGLFLIAFIKIFFLDLAGSPPLYRIGGCFLSSCFLMGGAWLYIRLQGKDSSGEKKKEEEGEE